MLRDDVLGPYRIVEQLGEGGMGAVYRARDTKLNRDVAIKVLLQEVADDPDRLARFTREAQTLAALNHPNIAHIHGIVEGPAEAGPHPVALVIELVEGEDLSQRIARGAIPLDEALPIAKQIAEALEAAHEQGIVHRDLKPANIKVRADGTVKVLDFGLAKALDTNPSSADADNSPTITTPTRAGIILGTAAYMSPEQARGRAVDRRADIWAFGAVLYEMLTARRAFNGDDVSELIASVLRDKVDLQALPPATPASVRTLIARCLERDPKLRLRDIGEARVTLSGAYTHEDAPPPSGVAAPSATTIAPSRWSPAAPWFVAGLAVAGLAMFAAGFRRSVPPPAPFPMRMEIADIANPFAALSPDGHMLVFSSGTGEPGQRLLYVRRLDQLDARAIPGTEGAQTPWFSADGRSVAYVANRRTVMKVALEGGSPMALGDVGDDGGGDWSLSGDIVAGSGVSEGLQGLLRVNQAGGGFRPFTQVDATRKELSHQWPRVLADGTSVLFTIWYGAADTAEIGVASLTDGKAVPLGVLGVRALGVVDGQLVFVRSDGVAMAVAFDVTAKRVSGTPVQVQDGIRRGDKAPAFMNNAGGLVYAQAGEPVRRLLWVDRSGTVRPAVAEGRNFSAVRIAPDGRQVALTLGAGGSGDIWIHDIANGTLTPLTTAGGARNAAWSPDGRRVLYVSTQGGRAALWWQAVDGSGAPTLASVPPHNAWNMDLAPDGMTTIYNAIYNNGSFNLESFALTEPHRTLDLAASPRAAESNARFSPDGKLVAYQSDESGRVEIYIRSFPDAGGRTQVSTDGGMRPAWGRDGTLYYSHEGSIMSATLARDATLRVLSRQLVVKGPFAQEFDVTPDGSRFLVLERPGAGAGATLVVIPNWATELRRLTAPAR